MPLANSVCDTTNSVVGPDHDKHILYSKANEPTTLRPSCAWQLGSKLPYYGPFLGFKGCLVHMLDLKDCLVWHAFLEILRVYIPISINFGNFS